MYLIRIRLNKRKKDARAVLKNRNVAHGIIERAFDDYGSRKLWRLDHLNGNDYLLIVSETKPLKEHLMQHFGCENAKEEDYICKDYDLVLNRIVENSQWRFHTDVVPSICNKSNGKLRHIVDADSAETKRCEWIMQKGKTHGFNVDSITCSKPSVAHAFRSNTSSSINLYMTTFDGVLTVTDVDKFTHLLTHGLGHQKIFGLGMMTLARV